MKECTNCERLKQRVAELNSELLVLKIAAFAAGAAKEVQAESSRKARTAPERKQANQPRVS